MFCGFLSQTMPDQSHSMDEISLRSGAESCFCATKSLFSFHKIFFSWLSAKEKKLVLIFSIVQSRWSPVKNDDVWLKDQIFGAQWKKDTILRFLFTAKTNSRYFCLDKMLLKTMEITARISCDGTKACVRLPGKMERNVSLHLTQRTLLWRWRTRLKTEVGPVESVYEERGNIVNLNIFFWYLLWKLKTFWAFE